MKHSHSQSETSETASRSVDARKAVAAEKAGATSTPFQTLPPASSRPSALPRRSQKTNAGQSRKKDDIGWNLMLFNAAINNAKKVFQDEIIFVIEGDKMRFPLFESAENNTLFPSAPSDGIAERSKEVLATVALSAALIGLWKVLGEDYTMQNVDYVATVQMPANLRYDCAADCFVLA